jgi:hypothetical protein
MDWRLKVTTLEEQDQQSGNQGKDEFLQGHHAGFRPFLSASQIIRERFLTTSSLRAYRYPRPATRPRLQSLDSMVAAWLLHVGKPSQAKTLGGAWRLTGRTVIFRFGWGAILM